MISQYNNIRILYQRASTRFAGDKKNVFEFVQYRYIKNNFLSSKNLCSKYEWGFVQMNYKLISDTYSGVI